MVHEHHVRVHRLAFCGKSRAKVATRALFAEARRSIARKLGPENSIARLAEGIAIVDVAGFRRHDPRNERHEGITFFCRKQLLRMHQQFFELAEAKVIVTAFQNSGAKFAIVNLCNLRNRFRPELFLQSASRSTDKHTFARNRLVRCSNQVRQSLSGTGRSFKNAKATLVHVAFHDGGKILLVVTRLVVFDKERNKAAFFKELAHTRSLGLGQSFLRRDRRQTVLRSSKRFCLCRKERFVTGTFGNLGKRIKKPRIHRRNLFEGLYKQTPTSIGIGQSAVRTAALNFEFLHQCIEAVIRNILKRNTGKCKRIPEYVGIVRNPDLRKSLLEELGIKKRIVGNNRKFSDKRTDLSGHRCKIRSFRQIVLANTR